MERVSKFYVPGSATLTIITPGATGDQGQGSTPFLLPSVFPLPPGYQTIWRWMNVVFNQSATSTLAATILNMFVRFQNSTGNIASQWPAFPLSQGNILAASPGNLIQVAYPVIPAPFWEWDDAMTNNSMPDRALVVIMLNVTALGVTPSFSVGFEGLCEVWKV